MKKHTIEYIIYRYLVTEAHPERHWDEHRQHFPLKQMAVDTIDRWRNSDIYDRDELYKLIERETIETEITL